MIFSFARNGGWFSTMLSSRLLVHLGEVSYSIYMTHAVVFEWAGRFLSSGFYGLHNEVWIIEAQVGLVLLVICLSDTLFRWVETPGRRLTRHFTQRHFN